MSDSYKNWKSLSRQLHYLCIDTFGEDLLIALLTLPPHAEREAVSEVVKYWLDELVLPEIQTLGEKRATELTSLLAQEFKQYSFSRRLAGDETSRKIRRVWDLKKQQWRDKKAVLAVIGQSFQEFLHDAHTDGSHRKQNWQRMQQAIRILRQDMLARADKECWHDSKRHYELNRFDHDFAWLANEVLAYFQHLKTIPQNQRTHGLLKDVKAVETILQYFYDFMPGLVIGLPEYEDEAFATNVPLMDEAVISLRQCIDCWECVTRLSDEERQVINLTLSKEETGESDAQLAKRMDMKRGTFLKRKEAAMEKLRQCLAEGFAEDFAGSG